MRKKYKIPCGVQDFLREDCFAKNAVESRVMASFEMRGYSRVETPSIEYFDLFLDSSSYTATQNLFKFTDSDGELLVLRPDVTLPISRIVATKLKGINLHKFCYLGKCFNFMNINNRLREFTQAGVEIIGKASALIDAECIALSIDSLLAAGLEDIIIDLGQIQFFKGLLADLKLGQEDEAELINLVDKKDMFGVEMFSKARNISQSALELVKKLPTLYGGVEVLDKALELCDNKLGRDAIYDLKEIYDILKTIGYAKYIAFDLSLVNGVSYYTGVVFKGMTKFFGAPVISGGRYNNLCGDSFAHALPAVGFAVGIENVCTALSKMGKFNTKNVVDAVIGFDKSQTLLAYEKMRQLVGEGKVIDNSFCDNIEDTKKYAKNVAHKEIMFFGSDKVEVLI